MMERGKHTVSVAMCTYNGEKYIYQQLESIICQTHPVDEIVICDDGSSDKTLEIAAELLNKHNVPYSIVCNEVGLGVTKNFEKAISLCSHDVIFTCDQDDLWHKNKVETMLQYFDKEDVVMVFSDGLVIDENNQVTCSSLHARVNFMQAGSGEKQLQDAIIRLHYTVHGCLMAFRKDFAARITPFPDSMLYHDAWIMYCASLIGKICYCKQPLISYRMHNQSITQGEAGQDKWRSVVQSGSKYSQYFSLNLFRTQRCMLIRKACKMDGICHNEYWNSYQRMLKYYDRMTVGEKKTAFIRIALILLSVLDGAYCYRFSDRYVDYDFIKKAKVLVSDIIFITKVDD